MQRTLSIFLLVACLTACLTACASSDEQGRSGPGNALFAQGGRVNADNFIRAETDTYFARFVQDGGFAKPSHERELSPIDRQAVIRTNRDTLYSFGVFDLEASPLTITLPDAGERYMACQVIDQNHYTPFVIYTPATRTITKDMIGTRYVCLVFRTFVDPNDPGDIQAVHALQDAIKIEQQSAGAFIVPEWDAASLNTMRAALLGVVQAQGGIDSARMFGSRSQVDRVQHLLGTAAGWGGNPHNAAMYVGATPAQNDGNTPHRLTLRDVPVDGFWSVSVYNKDGFFEKNARNAYTINNVTAKRDADGSVTIHFGGDENAPNSIAIMPGWNYLLRLYRPRAEILDGTWTPPEAQPVR